MYVHDWLKNRKTAVHKKVVIKSEGLKGKRLFHNINNFMKKKVSS